MTPVPDKPVERRSEIRLDEQATIFLEVMSSSFDNASPPTVVICNSLDVSANGIQVALDDNIAVGSILRLGVDLGEDSETIYLVGEAKWVRPDEDQFRVGFELYDAQDTGIAAWKQTIAELLNTPEA